MKSNVKTILAILLSLTAILSLCACDTEDGGAQVQSGQHSDASGLSGTETKQDTAASEKTVSVAVDPVPFDINDRSTWYDPNRSDLITVDQVQTLMDMLRESKYKLAFTDVVATVGKPHYEKYFDKYEDREAELILAIYKTSDGRVLMVSISSMFSEGLLQKCIVHSLGIVDNDDSFFGGDSRTMFIADGSNKIELNDLKKIELGMKRNEVVDLLGKPWYDSGNNEVEFCYPLTNGQYALITFSSGKGVRRVSYGDVKPSWCSDKVSTYTVILGK